MPFQKPINLQTQVKTATKFIYYSIHKINVEVTIEKKIPRGKNRKQRIEALKRILAEVRADPQLRADIKKFIKVSSR